ncbi:type VI secretion system baseplate subunit TssF [Burkholderia cepacia]|uniref:type VI secretion system baseplate subunit TssF n=1 Tax=Burkholderia cepacia TaxID=292 RepID=UPI001E48C43B|nr:type VI secretion system baseplate subunit TssF [Burkholderia cepacia]
MSPEDLLSYYERELTFLRQYVREFAAHYPKIASRLSLTGGMDSGRAAQMSAAVTVPRGTQLYSRPLNGSKILFRTAYDVTLSPLQLTGGAVPLHRRRAAHVAPACRCDGADLADVRDSVRPPVDRRAGRGFDTALHARRARLDRDASRRAVDEDVARLCRAGARRPAA